MIFRIELFVKYNKTGVFVLSFAKLKVIEQPKLRNEEKLRFVD